MAIKGCMSLKDSAMNLPLVNGMGWKKYLNQPDCNEQSPNVYFMYLLDYIFIPLNYCKMHARGSSMCF